MDRNFFHSNLEIIHINDIGFIGKCKCCNEIQFSIGNIVSFISESTFHILHSTLRTIAQDIEANSMYLPHGKRIMLKTPVHNIMLSLTSAELFEVLDLFSKADIHIKLLDQLEEISKQN